MYRKDSNKKKGIKFFILCFRSRRNPNHAIFLTKPILRDRCTVVQKRPCCSSKYVWHVGCMCTHACMLACVLHVGSCFSGMHFLSVFMLKCVSAYIYVCLCKCTHACMCAHISKCVSSLVHSCA